MVNITWCDPSFNSSVPWLQGESSSFEALSVGSKENLQCTS